MIKHIIREYQDNGDDANLYFDYDNFTSEAGDYCYNIFIINFDYPCNYCAFNANEIEHLCEQANALAESFNDIDNGYKDYFKNYKEAMEWYGVKYTSKKCHELKTILSDFDDRENKCIAEYLSIITGKTWEVKAAHGYGQGDYCEIIYCTDFYNDDDLKQIGDIYLGCYKAFSVIDLDESGEEVDTYYGFTVADSQIHCWADSDNEYKKNVCEIAGINPDETRLEMIDGYTTQTVYNYRAV